MVHHSWDRKKFLFFSPSRLLENAFFQSILQYRCKVQVQGAKYTLPRRWPRKKLIFTPILVPKLQFYQILLYLITFTSIAIIFSTTFEFLLLSAKMYGHMIHAISSMVSRYDKEHPCYVLSQLVNHFQSIGVKIFNHSRPVASPT